jgi:homoserine O-acetyltransferase/O-succinyltransferase
MNFPTQTGRFALGDLKLQSGEVLRDAALSWKSYGALSPARDNVIVYPTSYTAKHTDQEWLIAQDKVLDPTRWFIVTPDMFGNGLSSSPSNTPDYPRLVTSWLPSHSESVSRSAKVAEPPSHTVRSPPPSCA